MTYTPQEVRDYIIECVKVRPLPAQDYDAQELAELALKALGAWPPN